MLYNNYMIKKIIKMFIFVIFIATNVSFTFAAKYTMCKGKDFNTRIKMAINNKYNSSTPEYSITGFSFASYVKGNAIDISEDGDGSVLAYIDNNIIYCVSDEDVYLNSDISYMFDKFINLKRVDLTFFSFNKIRKANFMFGNCKYLNFVDLDNDTEIKLNEMTGMFFDCQSLIDLNLSMINTKNVKSFNSLFYNCKNLKNIIINPSIFKTNKVNNYNKMYYNCLSLKTNKNLKATDIKEEKYKMYTVPGSDYREGLLRDYDYDYDELVLDNKTLKVDSLKSSLTTSEFNTNTNKNLNEKDLEQSKSFVNINIASDSSLYNVSSVKRVNNNSNYKSTFDDVPILKEETTFVDKLIPKSKSTKSEMINEENELYIKDANIKNISTNSDIVINEKSTDSEIKGLLRPDYRETKIEDINSNIVNNETEIETYKVDEEVIEFDINEINRFDISNYYPQIIFCATFILILTGIIISNMRNKNEDL